jgi:hypothetical protein
MRNFAFVSIDRRRHRPLDRHTKQPTTATNAIADTSTPLKNSDNVSEHLFEA